METLKINITGSEALEMLQEKFPEKWLEMIEAAKEDIKSYMRIFNVNAVESYNKFVKVCCDPSDMIVKLAALHVMNLTYNLGAEIKRLESEIRQFGEQAAAMETSNTFSHAEKNELRGIYAAKQNEYQKTIEQLTSSFEVVGCQTIALENRHFNKAG